MATDITRPVQQTEIEYSFESTTQIEQIENYKFQIDEEFSNLLPPFAPEEYKALEESLLREGVREPLIVWQEKECLIDGHNRYKICKDHKITPKIREMSFSSREEVKLWIYGRIRQAVEI